MLKAEPGSPAQLCVERVEKILKAYEEGVWGLRDLLADLRHYADAKDIDFFDEDRVAHDNYGEEIHDTDRNKAWGAAPSGAPGGST